MRSKLADRSFNSVYGPGEMGRPGPIGDGPLPAKAHDEWRCDAIRRVAAMKRLGGEADMARYLEGEVEQRLVTAGPGDE